MFTTLLGTNWWNLGMAGKLPEFLCPRECVGTLDYVGLDYYWGVPSFWPRDLHRLSAASDFQYADAPVWPNALDMILREAAREFPGKPIIVIENGCVARASGVGRPDYLTEHVNQVSKARAARRPGRRVYLLEHHLQPRMGIAVRRRQRLRSLPYRARRRSGAQAGRHRLQPHVRVVDLSIGLSFSVRLGRTTP